MSMEFVLRRAPCIEDRLLNHVAMLHKGAVKPLRVIFNQHRFGRDSPQRPVDSSRRTWPAEVSVDELAVITVTEAMLGTGPLGDAGKLYLDVRLSQNHPTVEVRILDAPLDPGTTVTVAGLVRALVDTAANDTVGGRNAP